MSYTLKGIYQMSDDEKLYEITKHINNVNSQQKHLNVYTKDEISSIFADGVLDRVYYLIDWPKFEVCLFGNCETLIMGAIESDQIKYIPNGHFIYLYNVRRVNSNIWNLRYLTTDRLTDELLSYIRNEKIKEILQ
jgi:hypothetical protein